MFRLLHFLDLFPAKIQIDNDHGTSFRYENMNTSLVNINLNEFEITDEWFTLTSGNFLKLFSDYSFVFYIYRKFR